MYRINEIFYSIQGEGMHVGTPAVFVRFSGCNRSCAFCDTDHRAFSEMTAMEIVEMVEQYPTHFVVLTGGEPLLQADDNLLRALKEAGKFIAVETNGSLPANPLIDWVTCSPKDLPWGIDRVDEVKVVFTEDVDPKDIASHFDTPNLFLQPCSRPDGTSNVDATVSYILVHPRWRLSLQTHKLIGIR